MKEFMVVNIHKNRKNGQLKRYTNIVYGPRSEALKTAHTWHEVLTRVRDSRPFTENYPEFAYVGTIVEKVVDDKDKTPNTSEQTIH